MGATSGIPVVGLGGSAGALDAFKNFFPAVPADSGAAFVVIQHLAPAHKSLLPELLAQHTAMRVVEAQDGMPVEPNCVYVIPPNQYLRLRDGVLYLDKPVMEHGIRMPIDHFLRSLSEAACTTTLDGRVLFCNAPFGRLIRRPPEKIVGHSFREFVAANTLAEGDELLATASREPAARRLVLTEAGGEPVPVRVAASLLDHREEGSICVVASDLRELENSTEIIGQLRREQLALARSEQRHRCFIEKNFDAIFQNDREGRFVSANAAAERLSGYSEQELRQMTFMQLCAPDQLERTVEQFQAALAGDFQDVETAQIRKDGRRVELLLSGGPVVVEGRQEGIFVIARDITERKAAEQRLRQSRQQYRSLAKNLPGLVYRVYLSEDNRMQFFNDLIEPMTGYRAEELVRGDVCQIDSLIVEEDREQVRDVVRSAMRCRQPFEVTYRLRRKDGQIRHFSERGGPIAGPDGNLVFIDGVIFDVTERFRTEQALREMAQRLTYHMNNSPLAVIEWGPDMRLTRWLGAAERIFGWKEEEVLGKRMEDLRWIYHEDQVQVEEVSGELVTGKNPRRFSANRNYRKDGSVIHCEWHNSSLVDESGNLRSILSLVLDVTDRKQAEEALRTAKNELEHRVRQRTTELSQTVSSLQDEMSRRTLAEEVLRQRSEQLRLLASELTLAEQRERRRLAEVLHDNLQQLLVGAKLRLSLLDRSSDSAVKDVAVAVQDLLDESIQCSRSLTAELSPPILHQGGLVPALEWLAVWMQQKHGLNVELQTQDSAEPGIRGHARLAVPICAGVAVQRRQACQGEDGRGLPAEIGWSSRDYGLGQGRGIRAGYGSPSGRSGRRVRALQHPRASGPAGRKDGDRQRPWQWQPVHASCAAGVHGTGRRTCTHHACRRADIPSWAAYGQRHRRGMPDGSQDPRSAGRRPCRGSARAFAPAEGRAGYRNRG